MPETIDPLALDRDEATIRREIDGTYDEETDLGRRRDREMAAASDEARRRSVFDDFAKKMDTVRERRRALARRLADLRAG
jgi:hypothetical protein